MSGDDRLETAFSHTLGERLHVVTFARPSRYVTALAMSLQRAGGILNVLGAKNDVAPVPAEFKIDDSFRRGLDFKMAYGDNNGKEEKELGYRRILFKRLLFLWRLAVQLPPQDMLLYVDGNDVLFQRPLDQVISTWRRMVQGAPRGEEPVIFMGYPRCGGRFHEDHARVVYPLPGSHRGLRGSAACARWITAQPRGTLPYLDSGGYLGRASRVAQVLDEALLLARLGLDYICMSALTVAGIRLGPSWVRVDSEAELFYSLTPLKRFDKLENWTPEVERPLCGANYFDLAGQPPAFAPTGETPAVLHFVGPAKWYWLHPCMDAFQERRRLELIGSGAPGIAGAARTGDAAAAAAAGSAGAGFAGPSQRFCLFGVVDSGECEPCPGGRQDCPCAFCQTLENTVAYYDVDSSVVHTLQF